MADMRALETLQSLIDSLARHDRQQAVVALDKHGSRIVRYGELADLVERLAAGLVRAGVARGQSVAIFADNSPEWIVACLAVVKAGAVVVPIDVQLRLDLLRYVLADSGARLIFTTEKHKGKLSLVTADRKLEIARLDTDSGEQSWRRLMSEQRLKSSPVLLDDVAALFYTSGTTGEPKGVPLTHRNLTHQLNVLLRRRLLRSDDRVLLPLPAHHIYPFAIGVLLPLAAGVPIVLPYALTGPQLRRALHDEQVTAVAAVPRLYNALYAGIESRVGAAGPMTAAWFRFWLDISLWVRRQLGLSLGKLLFRAVHNELAPRLRILASGGAALDPGLGWKLEALGWPVAIGYGLTETSPLLTMKPPGKGDLTGVGEALPGVELRIDPQAFIEHDPSTSGPGSLAGQPGEVLARGPNVFAGYWNLPEKTQEAFTADGWFRTGDLGYFRGSTLHILGRLSTLIVTEAGKKFQPEDVEDAYAESPFIREVGVLQHGGKLVAVIVPDLGQIRRSGSGNIDHDIHEALAKRARELPSYQRLTGYVTVRDPLPRTRLGKICRAELAKLYEAAVSEPQAPPAHAGPARPEEMSEGDRALLDDPAAQRVWNWFAARYADKHLTPATSPQLDLGIDSLEWLTVTLALGTQTGVALDEAVIAEIDTIRDILRLVAEGQPGEQAVRRIQPLEDPEGALSEEQKKWLRPAGPVMSLAAFALYVLNWALMRILFRLRVKGAENVPEGSQVVLTPNHASYADAFVLAASLKYRFLRATHWAGWRGIAFANPVACFISRLAQAMPIDADHALVSSLALGAAVLKGGKNLIWFPEGRRTLTGELLPFKPGIGLLLHHFAVPVIPVYLEGTRQALPPGSWLPRPVQVTVRFGKSVAPHVLEQEGEGSEPAERIATALRMHVADLGRSHCAPGAGPELNAPSPG